MKKIITILVVFALVGLSAMAQAPNWAWAKSAGGGNHETTSSVHSDASGNVYITGYFSDSTITFGSTVLVNDNNGTDDIFLVKYDASGNVLWAKRAGGNDTDDANSITTDPWGNVYITGQYASGTIHFGNITLIENDTIQGLGAIFIAKYDASGNVIWAKSAGGNGFDFAYSITSDNAGNIYISGNYGDSAITFGSTILPITSSLFLTKYDSSGNVIWATSGGSSYGADGWSVATDPSGKIYLTGDFSSTISLGTTTLIGSGANSIYIAKFDSSGNVLWAKCSQGTFYDAPNSIAVDNSGNAFVTGFFESPIITFGSISLTNSSSDTTSDVFLVKYDSSGNIQWGKRAGQPAISEGADAVITDVFGNAYIAGNFQSGSMVFDTINISYPTMFLVKYSGNGNAIWGKDVGPSVYPAAMCIDYTGNIYITGEYSGTATFGSSTISTLDTGAIFLAKINNTVGICDCYSIPNISIYPNPTTHLLTISIANKNLKSVTLNLYDMMGQLMVEKRMDNGQLEMDIRDIEQGVYFLEVLMDGQKVVRKVVKIN